MYYRQSCSNSSVEAAVTVVVCDKALIGSKFVEFNIFNNNGICWHRFVSRTLCKWVESHSLFLKEEKGHVHYLKVENARSFLEGCHGGKWGEVAQPVIEKNPRVFFGSRSNGFQTLIRGSMSFRLQPRKYSTSFEHTRALSQDHFIEVKAQVPNIMEKSSPTSHRGHRFEARQSTFGSGILFRKG